MKHIALLGALLMTQACAEQQAPIVSNQASYTVVAYTGDDTSQETDVIAVCTLDACERIAADLNVRNPGVFYVE